MKAQKHPGNAIFYLACLVLILFSFAGRGHAELIYVNAGATGGDTGTTWADAYTDLQDALAAAEWGDEIWVAAGTYKPTSGTDRNISFVMTAGVAIYGGFAGTETDRTQRDWEANETILSGDIGVVGDNSDNSNTVVVGGDAAMLDGFTVTGGNGYEAAGMWNYNISIIIRNCIFIENTAKNANGGGMYNSKAYPIITNCTFLNNSSERYGGGMYNKNNSARVTDCSFINNSANTGGGMFNSSASPTVTNCTFSGNSANSGGGIYGGSGTVTNCTFSGNSVNGVGGGMEWVSGMVTNCTFSGNSASDGGGIYGGSGMVVDSIFSGNSAIGNIATGNGGGIAYYSGIVMNCTFSGNSAHKGGGILGDSGSVWNCLFTGNSASDGGGGLWYNYITNFESSDNPASDYVDLILNGESYPRIRITNCTFFGNSTSNSGGGLYIRRAINTGGVIYKPTFSPPVKNCIFWKNTNQSGYDEIYNSDSSNIDLTYIDCLIRNCGNSGSLWDESLGIDGGGNIEEDPMFVDMENPEGPDGIWMTADDGLALSKASPCIDAGDPTGAPATDILGVTRVGVPDMGAYECISSKYQNGVVSWELYR